MIPEGAAEVAESALRGGVTPAWDREGMDKRRAVAARPELREAAS
jgi:hypothetical protein